MKKLKCIAVILVVGMLLGTIPMPLHGNISVSAYSYSRADEIIAEKLMSRIDKTEPSVAHIVPLVEARKYMDALVAYRKVVIDRLRKTDLHEMAYHSWQAHAVRTGEADYQMGKITPEEYEKIYGRKLGWIDRYGIVGDPSQPMNIDWYPSGDDGAGYSTFASFVPLAAKYWMGYGDEYKDKWFQIADDFARNNKKQMESIPGKNRENTHECIWNFEMALSTLRQGDRAAYIIQTLAIFAKNLSDEERNMEAPQGLEGNPDLQSQWVQEHGFMDVLAPTTFPLKDEDYDKIPLIPFANIALSMIDDHPQALMARYVKFGSVPNQRYAGLYGLTLITGIFEGIKGIDEIRRQTGIGLGSYATEAFNYDGGMIEQSYNYNLKDLDKTTAIQLLCEGDITVPEGANKIAKRGDWFRKMLDSLQKPTGGLPMVGNQNPTVPQPIWRGDEYIEKNQKNYINYSNSVFANNSVTFPYSGYNVLRTGYDPLESVQANFLTSRKARGHTSANVNMLDLTAYGRNFIVSGGPSYYNQGDFPKEYIESGEASKYDDYFSEESSYKISTVLVDGCSQSVTNADGNIFQVVPKDPIQSRWYDSEHFTYSEGLWKGGYMIDETNKNMDVTHHRSVIQLSDLDMYIITDTMDNSGFSTHEYTQNWGFAPPPTDGTKGYPGFREDEVVIYKDQNMFRTEAEDGPNMEFYNYAPRDISIKKYFAAKEGKFKGWFSMGIGGYAYPRADVHVSWNDRIKTGKGESNKSSMVTLAVPSKTKDSEIRTSEDISDIERGYSGFDVVTKRGAHIAYLSAGTATDLQLADIEANAKTLLTVENESGTINGLLLDADSVSYRGSRIEMGGVKDFAFSVENGKFEIVSEIAIPTSFTWIETEDGIKPAYDRATEEEAGKLAAEVEGSLEHVIARDSANTEVRIRNIGNMIFESAKAAVWSVNDSVADRNLETVRKGILSLSNTDKQNPGLHSLIRPVLKDLKERIEGMADNVEDSRGKAIYEQLHSLVNSMNEE